MKVDTIDTTKWANRLVLLGLVSINIVLITPPTLLLFERSTLFVTTREETTNGEPFKWPSLIICRNPIVKNQTAFETFMQTMDSGAEAEAFFTNVSDYLYDVAIATDPLSMFTDTSLRWPLRPPYVSNFLSEYQYQGYCVEISLESIRKAKIQRGELKKEDPDHRFSVVLWLKETSALDEKYFLDIVEDGETGLVTTSKDGLISVRGNHVTLFQLEFEREQLIDQCSNQPKDFNHKMSTCLQKVFQDKYPNNKFMAYYDLGLARLNGLNYLANYTGCSRPCDRTVFQAKEFYASPLKYMAYREAKKPFPSQTEGTLLVINHVKQSSFSKHQEQYVYNGQSYISDVGGISGIFLGFSFWSFYEMMLQPFIKIATKCMQ